MTKKKAIPSIHVPIMTSNGSMELAWYLFLQWVSENAGATDLSDYFTKEETQALLDAKANIDDLADVAFSGNYDDLSNKPTIGNATITIKQGGVTKGSFTVNQTGDEEVDIDQGGSDVDNLTITKNADDEMQAVAVIDQNTGIAKTWTGTMAEYEAIVTKDPETEYIIIDDIGIPATEIGEITEALNNKVDKGFDIIEFQEPTAANGYTWYKKYRNGWVEQGGIANGRPATITLLIEMADTNYTLVCSGVYASRTNTNPATWSGVSGNPKSTTQIELGETNGFAVMGWQVSGMAAN